MGEGRKGGGRSRGSDLMSMLWSLMSLVLEFYVDQRSGIVYVRHSSIGLSPRGEVAGLLRWWGGEATTGSAQCARLKVGLRESYNRPVLILQEGARFVEGLVASHDGLSVARGKDGPSLRM